MKIVEDEPAPPAAEADAIASIWATVLGLKTCDHQTNFFDLGGSSLKMMRVHSELQRQLGVDTSIVELFAHPTVSALADRLAALRAASNAPPSSSRETQQPSPLARMFRPIKNRN